MVGYTLKEENSGWPLNRRKQWKIGDKEIMVGHEGGNNNRH
jgi:hypothetical protein